MIETSSGLPRKSLAIFKNLRKMFRQVRLVFGTILEKLRKFSQSSRKSLENHQQRYHQYVYIIKRTLHIGSKIWILRSHDKKFLPREHKISPPCNIRYNSQPIRKILTKIILNCLWIRNVVFLHGRCTSLRCILEWDCARISVLCLWGKMLHKTRDSSHNATQTSENGQHHGPLGFDRNLSLGWNLIWHHWS